MNSVATTSTWRVAWRWFGSASAPARRELISLIGLTAVAQLLGGCAAPIGADKVTTRQAYAQVDANPLRNGKPSADTRSLLHRYGLEVLGAKQPDEAVRELHEKAIGTGQRDLLFALSELSYLAGDQVRRSVKPWDPRDARDFYLGSAVYAYLYLFGPGKDPAPSPFDRRYREACDFYNYALGQAFMAHRSTNANVYLKGGKRPLPKGEVEVQLAGARATSPPAGTDELLLVDKFRVRGLSVRNREAGVGAPVIAVSQPDPQTGLRRCRPGTLLLRLEGSLADFGAGNGHASLELHSTWDASTVDIGGAQVPLETDLTTYRAYTLNQSMIWQVGFLQFLAPAQRVRSQLILEQPYTPGRIPLVFVHGTFSSPVTWAEMANSLIADPELRRRYQLWSFVYSTGNPMPVSAGELRDALTAKLKELDPDGKDPALKQVVMIGHSQGGLLTKLCVTETGDRLWNVISTNRIEDLKIDEAQREKLRHWVFLDPLPGVRRVVFIATPHHGSYLSSNFARKWAHRLMALPGKLVSGTQDLFTITKGSSAEKFLSGRVPTSLDSMSPDNPVLLALAKIPVAPGVEAHSIIPVLGEGDLKDGKDGVVAYQSAHIDYVESEYIVHGPHSCLNMPATIEEVRRILHEHLDTLGTE